MHDLEIVISNLILLSFSMNGLLIITLAIAAIASIDIAQATFVLSTAAATTGTATTLSSASVASLGLLGGIVLLKGLIGVALLSSRGRGKRSAQENDDAAFAVLANSEPAQCYRRLICDMAAGAISDDDHILALFNNEVDVTSPKFEFATAAKVGKIVKNYQYCEIRYTCPLNTSEIQKLFN